MKLTTREIIVLCFTKARNAVESSPEWVDGDQTPLFVYQVKQNIMNALDKAEDDMLSIDIKEVPTK